MRLFRVVFLIYVFTMSGCADDESSNLFFRVKTLPISEVSSDGAVFKAQFESSQINKITNHGFVWSKSSSLSTLSSYSINLGKPKSNEFSAIIGYQLDKSDYYVRAFVETDDDLTVYGEKLKFTSLGSEGPVLTKISPSQIELCDTLIIEGKNFIENSTPYLIINDKKQTGFKVDARKNQIRLKVSSLFPATNVIKVGFDQYVASKQVDFQVNSLSATLISPTIVRPLDTIKVQFSKIPECVYPSIAPIGYCYQCGKSVIDRTKNQVQFIIANTCLPGKVKFQVGLEEEIYQTPEIQLLSTEITSVSPSTAKLGDVITITGKYLNSVASSLMVRTSEFNFYVLSASSTKITFQVPTNIPIPADGKVNATLNACGENINFQFNLALPKITSISPLDIITGEEMITITGENFVPGLMSYELCGVSANFNLLEETETQIKFQLSDFYNIPCSEFNVRILLNNHITESKDKIRLSIEKPFKQLSSFPGGARISSASFSIGNYGFVGLGQLNEVMNTDLWMYDVVANSWSRKADFPGTPRIDNTTFVIGNKAYIGLGHDINLNPLYDFWEYDFNSNTWKGIADFPSTLDGYSIAFAIGSKGYVARPNLNEINFDFWEYNPALNNWTKKAEVPQLIDSYEAPPFFSSPSHGYYFGEGQLHKYDPISNSWTSEDTMCGYITIPGATFLFGEKIFMFSADGSTNYILNDPNCQQLLFMDQPTINHGPSSFIINGKGYLGIGQNGTYFWEFDPGKL